MGLLSAFGGLFGRRPSPGSREASARGGPAPVSVTAQFNHKIGPLERGERYEDPLNEALAKHGYGETDGGGTMQTKEGETEFCDVHMFLNSPDASIPFVIRFLEGCGAPKKSFLTVYDENDDVTEKIPFGVREGFAVYLDGVNLPPEVYQSCDSNVVVSEINQRLQGHGKIESNWQGPTETALYIYGDFIATMKPLIQDFLASYPLCKGARVVDLTA